MSIVTDTRANAMTAASATGQEHATGHEQTTHEQTMDQYQGTIVQVNSTAGFGYLLSADSKKRYPFTFDKVKEYGGEEADEFGLCEGRAVTYYLDQRGVRLIELSGKTR
jgi:hypothetical protein